jgi:1-acyl-sn-glycerol-3-phosphate acyltransferase
MKKLKYISPLILQTIIWIPTRIIFFLFGRLRVRGLENLTTINGSVIFAPNHSSELDPVLIPASLAFFSRLMPMFYTSREQSFYKYSSWRKYIYGGTLFKLWGSYPVYPGKNNFDLSLPNHIEILRNNKSLCMFPEGKKTRDGNLGLPKAGVAYLAQLTQCAVVPVYISGVYQTKFSDFILRKNKISVTFGRPLYYQDLLKENSDVVSPTNYQKYQSGAVIVMTKIKELKMLEDLSNSQSSN